MANFEEIPEVSSSRTFHQLGILILDGSPSMNNIGDGGRTLAENVNVAVREFLGYFKESSQKNNFSMAVIAFDNAAKVHTPITELVNIDDFADYNPMNEQANGTFIGGGLDQAQKLATEFLNSSEAIENSIEHSVSLIVMSDGLCLKADKTIEIAEQIKQNSKIKICSALFTERSQIGSEEIQQAKSVLLQIASSPGLYKTTYSEADLRQFFISSMSANTKYAKN
jgi:uncharacterized protein YegL